MARRMALWILVLQLLSATGIAYAVYRAVPGAGVASAVVIAVLVVLLVRMSFTASNFLLSWRHRSVTPPAHALTPAARLRLFGGEYRANVLATSWHMPRHRASAAHLDDTARATLPVLLVHGYGCNGGYWTPLRAVLRAAGIGHTTLDLEPVIADIDDYGRQVDGAVRALCAATGAPQAIIVAHSMGGLAARACLRSGGAAHIARVITLGTPHHGTHLAKLGPGINAQQMRWQSPWLLALAASEDDARRALITSIWSHHDNIVAPQTSCYLPGAVNREFSAVGHVALGSDTRIMQAIVDEIASAPHSMRAMDMAGFVR